MTILFQRFVNTFNDFMQKKITEDDLQGDIQEALSVAKIPRSYVY
jgi:hypothetical protein